MKTTLFNKGHIQIYKKDVPKNACKDGESLYYNVYINEVKLPYESIFTPGKNHNNERVYEDTIHESPLGFYYATTECINEDKILSLQSNRYYNYSSSIAYEYKAKNIIYTVTFFEKVGNVRVSADTRPWELLDKGMDEHFIYDLFDILKAIKADIDTNMKKNEMVKYVFGQKKESDFNNDWRSMMKDIFGFEDGPKFQSNAEKIEAAGFDVKTSFRNM